MDERQLEALGERVERLERVVSELRHVIGQIHEALLARKVPGQIPPPLVLPSDAPPGDPPGARPSIPMRFPPGPPRQPSPRPISWARRDVLWRGEYWFNKIGIGLLLLGVVFLFKYSIDRGWLSPPIRGGLGILLGSGLLALGLRLRASRPAFGQVLQGGGVATFYITGFASYYILQLVSYPLAFGFMVATTLLAFALSLGQDDPVLSLIGAIGGLGTPFLLPTGSASLAPLVVYTSLILAGTLAIDFAKEWRSLLWTAFVGGWAIFGMGALQSSRLNELDRLALQAGIAFGWLAFGTAPLARSILGMPDQVPGPRISADTPHARMPWWRDVHSIPGDVRDLVVDNRKAMVVLTPLIALPLSMMTWASSAPVGGWLALGTSAVYGLVSLLRRRRAGDLPAAYGYVSVLLLTTAMVLLLPANILFVALATEAAVLHAAARWVPDRVLSAIGHGLSLVVGLWLLVRLTPHAQPWAALDFRSFADLAAIGLAVVASARVQPRDAALAYRLAANLAMLGWLWRQCAAFPNGNAIATIAWGVDAVALLVLGLRCDSRVLLKFGMGTLLAVVCKLFLIDLASLDPLWRILMFLGFGGLFLALSFYFPHWWRPAPKSADKADWSEIGPSGPPRG